MFRKTGSNKMRNSWMSYFRVKELEKGSEHIKKKKTIDHIRGRKWRNEEHTGQGGRLSTQSLNKARNKG